MFDRSKNSGQRLSLLLAGIQANEDEVYSNCRHDRPSILALVANATKSGPTLKDYFRSANRHSSRPHFVRELSDSALSPAVAEQVLHLPRLSFRPIAQAS